MKFITFIYEGNEQFGIIQGELVFPLSPLFSSMHEMLSVQNQIEELEQFLQQSEIPPYRLEEVHLLAPIQPVRNIYCVGWNYLEHFEERTQKEIELPSYPTFFTKAVHTINGPDSQVPLDDTVTQKLDYEAELAIVIGKSGKNISEHEAMDYIFGYTCANDITARDIQFAHGGQWFKGKSLDKTCPLGPYLISKDEIENPQQLQIECRVNNQTVQLSNTKYMYFKIPQIIAELSKGMTLEIGDIILTGTPSGIGSKRNPPLFLKKGDIVTVEIENIGLLRNTIQ